MVDSLDFSSFWLSAPSRFFSPFRQLSQRVN